MAERYGLTKRHYALLEFVKSYIDEHGYSPNYEEIAQAMGMKHKARVHYVVKALVRRGYLVHTSASRSLAIPSGSDDTGDTRKYKLEAALAYIKRHHPVTFCAVEKRFGV